MFTTMATVNSSRPRSRQFARRGFTLIELLNVVSIISITIGLLLPAVMKVREAATHAAVKQYLVEVMCLAMCDYYSRYGTYPAKLNDPKLKELLPDQKLPAEALQGLGAITYKVDFRRRPPTFELCVFVGQDFSQFLRGPEIQLDYDSGRLNAYLKQYQFEYMPIYCITDVTCDCDDDDITHALRFNSYAEYLRNTPAVNPDVIPAYNLPVGMLASASEMLTPLYEVDPGLIRRTRTEIRTANYATSVLVSADTNGDSAISGQEILNASSILAWLVSTDPTFDNLASVPSIPIADLGGDPAELFSYNTLERLSEFYCDKPGVGHSLRVKVAAAQFAWEEGDYESWLDAMLSYENELDAQTDKSIAAAKARTLKALLHTF